MKENSYDAAIERRNAQTKDIFEKAAQETTLNHTMVGITSQLNVTPSLYNPHNYRLYFSFTKSNYEPKGSMVGVWLGKFINYGKEFTAVGNGVRITVRKTKVEVINKLSEEQWFSIEKSKAKEEINAILNKIDDKCVSALKDFIGVFGGKSDYIILNRENRALYNNLNTKSDNKVMKERFIDALPDKMSFETSIVKKVYKENNVEFKEPLYAAQYLENSALNDYGSIIVKRLEVIEKAQDILVPFTEQLRLHLAVLSEMRDTLKDIRQGRGEGKALFSPRIYKASSKPTPPNALKYNIRDSFPEGWFE